MDFVLYTESSIAAEKNITFQLINHTSVETFLG